MSIIKISRTSTAPIMAKEKIYLSMDLSRIITIIKDTINRHMEWIRTSTNKPLLNTKRMKISSDKEALKRIPRRKTIRVNMTMVTT